jgi:uncharacterized damage-inducible protein DinB
MIQRPTVNEYNTYFQRYIDLVPEGELPALFDRNTHETISLFSHLPSNLHNFRYAEGKWTVKEMLMHIIDTERVFSYRMLVAARGDAATPLHKMEENLYAAHVDVSQRSLPSLLEEFSVVRKSMKFLIDNLSDEQSMFLADAITYKVSARALAFITVGHAMHHMNVLNERYVGKSS